MTQYLKAYCSRYFTFEALFHCGDTWENFRCQNFPIQQRSWDAYEDLAKTLLDPIVDNFGEVQLTFGFCGKELRQLILKNTQPRIAPQLDQHASYEQNTKGEPICKRLGAAVDLKIDRMPSKVLATWIAANLPFDRLYYYGVNKPIHVSVGPQNSQQIILLKTIDGRRIPRKISLDTLKKLQETVKLS
ncbi:MAG: hypothetical protein ACRCT7_12035 [Shewanella sp.]